MAAGGGAAGAGVSERRKGSGRRRVLEVTLDDGGAVLELELVGYAHASLARIMRDGIMLDGRRRTGAVRETVTATPCTCPDDHVEVYTRAYRADKSQADGWQTRGTDEARN